MNPDLELQQYLFDLQGYLVIENALTSQEVYSLNALLDQQRLPDPTQGNRFGSAPKPTAQPLGGDRTSAGCCSTNTAFRI